MDLCTRWAQQTPVVTRYTIMGVMALTLAAVLLTPEDMAMWEYKPSLLFSSPLKALLGFVASPLVESNMLLQILFVISFGGKFGLGSRFEREFGSVKFLLVMATMVGVVNVFATFFTLLSTLVGAGSDFYTGGIMLIAIPLWTIQAFLDPSSSRRDCCGLMSRKGFVTVLAVLSLGFLFLGSPRLDYVGGLLAGALFSKGLLGRATPTDQQCTALETGQLAFLGVQLGFVSTESRANRPPFSEPMPDLEDEEWGLGETDEEATLLQPTVGHVLGRGDGSDAAEASSHQEWEPYHDASPVGQNTATTEQGHGQGQGSAPLSRQEAAALRAEAALSRFQRTSHDTDDV